MAAGYHGHGCNGQASGPKAGAAGTTTGLHSGDPAREAEESRRVPRSRPMMAPHRLGQPNAAGPHRQPMMGQPPLGQSAQVPGMVRRHGVTRVLPVLVISGLNGLPTGGFAGASRERRNDGFPGLGSLPYVGGAPMSGVLPRALGAAGERRAPPCSGCARRCRTGPTPGKVQVIPESARHAHAIAVPDPANGPRAAPSTPLPRVNVMSSVYVVTSVASKDPVALVKPLPRNGAATPARRAGQRRATRTKRALARPHRRKRSRGHPSRR